MPPRATRSSARRTASGGGSGPAHASNRIGGGKQQSALSFAGRVTKPGSARSASDKDKKEKTKNLEDKAEQIQRADITTTSTSTTSTTSTSPKTHEPSDEQQQPADSSSNSPSRSTRSARSKRPRSDSDFQPILGVQGLKDSDSLAPATALAIRAQADAKAEEEEVTAEEQAALKVPETQIKKYWAAKEAERTTPRVHQQGLSLHEKVLREFDMSAQFGNAIGIPRTRRWLLANELGLAPPIEVLAVLVKEDQRGRDAKVQRAHVDELMSSRFVIA